MRAVLVAIAASSLAVWYVVGAVTNADRPVVKWGDEVYLRTPGGEYVDVVDGSVRAHSPQANSLPVLTIESRTSALGYGTGGPRYGPPPPIVPDDIIYLHTRSFLGLDIDPCGPGNFKVNNEDVWIRRGAMRIDRSGAGPIRHGDTVYLRTYAGNHIEVLCNGIVWDGKGIVSGTPFVIEAYAVSKITDCSDKYKAHPFNNEHVQLSGGAVRAAMGEYKGMPVKGYVDFEWNVASAIEWTVPFCAGGTYRAQFTHQFVPVGTCSMSDGSLQLSVNDVTVANAVLFPSTGRYIGLDSWDNIVVELNLTSQTNTIKLVATADHCSGGVKLEHLVLTQTALAPVSAITTTSTAPSTAVLECRTISEVEANATNSTEAEACATTSTEAEVSATTSTEAETSATTSTEAEVSVATTVASASACTLLALLAMFMHCDMR